MASAVNPVLEVLRAARFRLCPLADGKAGIQREARFPFCFSRSGAADPPAPLTIRGRPTPEIASFTVSGLMSRAGSVQLLW